MRILGVADEIDPALDRSLLEQLRPDLILGCGDLPFDYLEYLRAATDVPLCYVRGNHDPAPEVNRVPFYLPARFPTQSASRNPARVVGGLNVDGRLADELGIRIVGLGGSIRYSQGPNQYTQREMRGRVRRVSWNARLRRWRDGGPVDVVIAHSPPLDCGDGEDAAHRGFKSFHRLLDRLQPRLMLHGHVHPHGFPRPDRTIGPTRVVNVIPFRLIEFEP